MGTGAEIAIPMMIMTAVGTGISVYSQMEQAETQEQVAQYNYVMQQRNAELNARLAKDQASWSEQTAMAQYQAQQTNAAALNDQARAAEAQGREQARRLREEKERTLATQRARFAGSGVTSEGSPLAVLADTAGLLELQVQDAHHQSDLEARSWDRKAELMRYESGASLYDAGVARYQSAVAEMGRRMDLHKTEVGLLSGNAAAKGARASAHGTLLSGAASSLSPAYKIK